jgi:hypothetical protein
VLIGEVANGTQPQMKEFLESKGRPAFQDLMLWVQSTDYAKYIHWYDDIGLPCPNDLETRTVNVVRLEMIVYITWAFNVSVSELRATSAIYNSFNLLCNRSRNVSRVLGE